MNQHQEYASGLTTMPEPLVDFMHYPPQGTDTAFASSETVERATAPESVGDDDFDCGEEQAPLSEQVATRAGALATPEAMAVPADTSPADDIPAQTSQHEVPEPRPESEPEPVTQSDMPPTDPPDMPPPPPGESGESEEPQPPAQAGWQKVVAEVRERLHARGGTPKDFAEASGIPESTIETLIANNRMPRRSTIVKTMQALGYNDDELAKNTRQYITSIENIRAAKNNTPEPEAVLDTLTTCGVNIGDVQVDDELAMRARDLLAADPALAAQTLQQEHSLDEDAANKLLKSVAKAAVDQYPAVAEAIGERITNEPVNMQATTENAREAFTAIRRHMGDQANNTRKALVMSIPELASQSGVDEETCTHLLYASRRLEHFPDKESATRILSTLGFSPEETAKITDQFEAAFVVRYIKPLQITPEEVGEVARIFEIDDVGAMDEDQRTALLAENPKLVAAVRHLRIVSDYKEHGTQERVGLLANLLNAYGVTVVQALDMAASDNPELARTLLNPKLSEADAAIRASLYPGEVRQLREGLLAKVPHVITKLLESGAIREPTVVQSMRSLTVAQAELVRRNLDAAHYLTPRQLMAYKILTDTRRSPREVMTRLSARKEELARITSEIARTLHTRLYNE